MSSSYVSRVVDRAARVDLARAGLSVLAAPLYALGWLAGLVLLMLAWMFAAAAVGFADGRRRAG